MTEMATMSSMVNLKVFKSRWTQAHFTPLLSMHKECLKLAVIVKEAIRLMYTITPEGTLGEQVYRN